MARACGVLDFHLRVLVAVVAWSAVSEVTAQSSAPVVEFVGRAPKLRIYPGGKNDVDRDSDTNETETETWLMLTFGKIEELDATGRRVTARAIMSLAAEKGIIWTQENRTVGGATALVTRMELPLEYGGSFKETCAGAGGGGKTAGGDTEGGSSSAGLGGGGNGNGGGNTAGGELDSDAAAGNGKGGGKGKSRRLGSAGSIAIEIFVFSSAAMVEYGDFDIEVAPGQLKFNVESVAWPFCGADHRLEVNLDIKVPGDKPPKSVEEQEERQEERQEARGGGRKGPKPKGKAVRQSAGGRDVSFDLPEVALVDNSSVASEVLVDSSGGKTTIVFRFPFFEDTLLYDPIVGFDGADDAVTESPSMAEATTTAQEAGGTSSLGESVKATTSVAATTMPGTTVVSGSLKMSVEDPAAFCGSAEVVMGLRKAIARAAKQDVSVVAVTCSVVARRLQSGRRLAGMVEVDYTVSLPPGTSSESCDAVVASLTSISTEELTSIVNEELKSAGAEAEVEVTAKGGVRKADPNEDSGMTSLAAGQGPIGALGVVAMAWVAHRWA